ncbi:MAG: hypothetical protein AB7T08_03715 [Hyphomonadaceae bacterium]
MSIIARLVEFWPLTLTGAFIVCFGCFSVFRARALTEWSRNQWKSRRPGVMKKFSLRLLDENYTRTNRIMGVLAIAVGGALLWIIATGAVRVAS